MVDFFGGELDVSQGSCLFCLPRPPPTSQIFHPQRCLVLVKNFMEKSDAEITQK